MSALYLTGCHATPFGGYLKSLAVLRLVSEQLDSQTRAFWAGDTLCLESTLDAETLVEFFLTQYSPTPIVGPWNGGSGFYEKDRKIGVNAIFASFDERFSDYRDAIALVRDLPGVKAGKAEKNAEDERRSAILRSCRNLLSDRAVEWLDAAVGIAADGSRAFAPVLGTGGNEGRLDYTNNFMERVATLLVNPDPNTPVRELLANSLFGTPTVGLQDGAAGQYDPGRAGGANQGQGIADGSPINPWDLILTLEGAVAWASGLHRRQGVGNRALLCSPFTVSASRVGYGSASAGDDARAEIWAPLWNRPSRYAEVKVLLREGRADVAGSPAKTGVQFAEAACSLGIDRGIDRFVRYSLLKRRGDSYVALPAGVFPTGFRSASDRVREIDVLLTRIELPSTVQNLKRAVDSALFEALLHDTADRMRQVIAALGRLLRRLVTAIGGNLPRAELDANAWLAACGSDESREVRIAAALASIWDRDAGPFRDNLSAGNSGFAWFGRDLSSRMVSVLKRRLQTAASLELSANPIGGGCALHPGDATIFIEGSTDDGLIEDLLFGFTCLNWKGFKSIRGEGAEVLPIYALLKHLFLPGEVEVNGERKRLFADPRVLSLLVANRIAEATEVAKYRLRVAGMRPIDVLYHGGVDPGRLAAALLIPIRPGSTFRSSVLHEMEEVES
jgi:CRISPR-associated protein Csx17